MSGPAILTTQGWMFPVHAVGHADRLDVLQHELDAYLTRARLTPLGARPPLPPRWRVEPLTPPA